MQVYRLLCAGLWTALAVLIIGVLAAYLQLPYSMEIIAAALTALTLLIRGIYVNLSSPRNGGLRDK
jgi:hypothetical protein